MNRIRRGVSVPSISNSDQNSQTGTTRRIIITAEASIKTHLSEKDQDGGGDNDSKYEYACYSAAAQIRRRSSLMTTNPSVGVTAIANEKSNVATAASASKAGSGSGWAHS
mmetsp:Transcript_3432/g.3995  ORF Transcript_3432/g.3995 Transcript_3432/m.3995 type:complete len:110 (+) Transcript_3432:455-784(+)